MKITVCEPLSIDSQTQDKLAAPFRDQGIEVVFYPDKTTDLQKLAERCSDADIVITANQPFPEAVVKECKKAKLIDVAFTGTDHVDKKTAADMGISVCNAQGYATEAVAELVMALAVDVLRSIVPLDAAVRKGGARGSLAGRELKGKTFGIVGTGAIGIRTAELAKAFGCKVIGWSRSIRTEAQQAGIEYVSFEDVVKNSDILSLNVPLTDSTRGLIGEKELKMMKRSAILINTARGPVVEEAALAQALKDGEIAGAGIDVFAGEPPLAQDSPILSAPNTVLTPHIAYATEESFSDRAAIVFDNALSFIDGNPRNIV
ncbi:MAG: NAD(P)-dependent oxidoreductase [Eubacteriaceae bacterium]|jgi:phosphoglycerate dehydrogenase-like enzyme